MDKQKINTYVYIYIHIHAYSLAMYHKQQRLDLEPSHVEYMAVPRNWVFLQLKRNLGLLERALVLM